VSSKLRSHAPLAVALIALFLAVGGPSFAAGAVSHAARLITGKQVKDNSLTTKDIKNRSLLAKDFKAGQLPKGPQGDRGPQGLKGDTGAAGAGSEATHLVGASGEPGFTPESGSPNLDASCPGSSSTAWANTGLPWALAGFYRDPAGTVHLQGHVKDGVFGCAVFRLPAGYWPGQRQMFVVMADTVFGRVEVTGANDIINGGGWVIPRTVGNNTHLSLNTIAFRCAPSGSNGCP